MQWEKTGEDLNRERSRKCGSSLPHPWVCVQIIGKTCSKCCLRLHRRPGAPGLGQSGNVGGGEAFRTPCSETQAHT